MCIYIYVYCIKLFIVQLELNSFHFTLNRTLAQPNKLAQLAVLEQPKSQLKNERVERIQTCSTNTILTATCC